MAAVRQRWEVVGGGEAGGVIVRRAADIKSEAEKERLSTGALVEELSLQGARLNFRRLSGSGPATGWVTVRLQAKELLVRTDKKPPEEEGADRGAATGEGEPEKEKEKFDPYKLLGVEPDATDAVIKSAYRRGSLAVHPDRHPDDADAARKFRELTHAKDFLLNPFKRRLYNLRHGLLKPTAGQIWWSDWDAIFEELAVDEAELGSEAASSSIPASLDPSSGGGLVDVLVLGATGITGTLACSLLHRGLFGSRSWSIAGRDGRKLGLLEAKFGSAVGFRGSSRIEAPADIEAAVRGARVVVDLTGPSREIGLGVAAACVRARRHCVDNTGEVDFSKMVKDKLDGPAKAAGTCLLLHSGYCSVPVDFAVWRMVRYLRERYGVPTRRVDAYDSTSGMVLSGTNYVSGGIWGGEDTKGVDPFLLGGLRKCGVRPEDEERHEPREDSNTGTHGILAAVSDRLVVRSSCGLFDETEPYGEHFNFNNWASFPSREAATHGMMMSRVAQKMHASLVKQKKIPPVGSGPSERVRQECLTSRVFVAEADEPGPRPRKAYCIMHAGPGGFGDRYEGTATMSLELACTLLDAEDRGDKGALRPGWGTPTYHTAHLGFFDRLVAKGARFGDIVDGPPPHGLFQNLLGAAMALESGES